jgi:hypothetical protein
MDVASWQEDMRRERSVVVTRRWVLRATVFEIRLEGAAVFADLRAMGVPTLAELSAPQRAIASRDADNSEEGVRGWPRGRSGPASTRRCAMSGGAASTARR